MNIPNINDVSSSVSMPKNPHSNKSKDSAKEDFMSLMSDPAQNIGVNISTSNNDMDTQVNSLSVQDISKDSNSFNSVKDNISQKEDDGIDVKSVKEAIEKFTEEVKDEIKKELGVSDEEIESAMENLGLAFVDLTKPENLVSLLKELNGTQDSVNLLLDTSVKEVFDEVSNLGAELFENTGLDTEDLVSIDGMELLEEPIALTEDVPKLNISSKDIAEFVSNDKPAEVVSNIEIRTTEDTKDTETVNEVDIEAGTNIKATTTKDNSQNSFDMSGNTNQNQSSMNTASEPVINPESHVNDFSQNIAEIDADYEVPTYTSVNTQDVIDQIVSQARVSITTQVRSMEMELNPQHLGRLLMQVSESEGQVTARFLTQSESVKTALEGAIANLVERLNEQGVKVDAVEVSVGTHEFEQNLEQNFAGDAREDLNSNESGSGRNDNRSRGGIHLGDAEYMEGAELSEEEELTASIMRTYGNTVNFKA